MQWNWYYFLWRNILYLGYQCFLVLKRFLVVFFCCYWSCIRVEIQTNGELNTKCQVMYTGADRVAHYHPLIRRWKNNMCNKGKKKGIYYYWGEGKQAFVLQVKSCLLDHVSTLASISKACFLFGFLWLDSEPLGGSLKKPVVHQWRTGFHI